MKLKKRKEYFIFAGLLYGIILSFLSFLSAGAGHGSYVLLGMFSSPFGFFDILTAFLMIPVIWTVFGLLTAYIDFVIVRLIFLVLIAVHYVAMFFLLREELYGDWEHLFRHLSILAPVILVGFTCYLAGQLVMWHRFIKSSFIK
jgi:hypothetical protein